VLHRAVDSDRAPADTALRLTTAELVARAKAPGLDRAARDELARRMDAGDQEAFEAYRTIVVPPTPRVFGHLASTLLVLLVASLALLLGAPTIPIASAAAVLLAWRWWSYNRHCDREDQRDYAFDRAEWMLGLQRDDFDRDMLAYARNFPRDARAHVRLGHAYVKHSRLGDGLHHFTQAHEAAPAVKQVDGFREALLYLATQAETHEQATGLLQGCYGAGAIVMVDERLAAAPRLAMCNLTNEERERLRRTRDTLARSESVTG
jgi:hypothetical protein